MTERRNASGPDPKQVRAAELSAMFEAAGWMPSTESFADRPFVKWHGSWFSAAGFPPGQGSHATVRRTDQEIIDWLNSFKVGPEPVPETVTEAERPSVVTEQDRVDPLGYEDEAPEPDPRDEELERLRAERDAEKAAREAAEKRLAELEAAAEQGPIGLPPNPSETKLSDYGEVGEDADLEPDHLLDFMRADKSEDMADTGDIIAKLSSAKRKRFTELLNIELAELQQKHGAAGENLTRETEIEKLLGLFARVGEM